VADEDGDPSFHLLKHRLQEGQIGGGILDADGVIEVEQHTLGGPPLEVGARALRDVVQHDGQPHPIHRFEVVVHLVEGGLEEIGSDDQRAGRARVPGPLGQCHRLAGGGAAGAGQHRHAPSHLVQADLDNPPAFFDRHVRELAGRAAGHHAVHVGQHEADQFAVRRLVQSAV
jgi:hypothetical protein